MQVERLRPGGGDLVLDAHPISMPSTDILTLVGRRVLDIKCPDPLDETLHAALLKDAHQGRPQGLAGVGRDLGDGGLGARSLLDEATSDLLELEIAGDISRNEDVGKLARRHEELGHQVDVPVVQATVILPWLGVLGIVAILLEELRMRKVGMLATDQGFSGSELGGDCVPLRG